MIYHHAIISANCRRNDLQREAQRLRIAALTTERRRSIRTIRLEIDLVGRLTDWRLQWKLYSETKVISNDPIPYSG